MSKEQYVGKGGVQGCNEFGQPIGPPVPNWTQRPWPPRAPLVGRYCRLEPIGSEHARDLFEAYQLAPDGRDWTYMASGPFSSFESFSAYVVSCAASKDMWHHAIVDLVTHRPVGTLALMRCDPIHGSIEVGSVAYSRRVQRTPMGTEAQYLLMKRVFDELGYRRYEWKCDHLNEPSRAAALRYGFQFEGIFRNAVVYKGRSRDTAWYSITKEEWPRIGRGFEVWLSPENFHPNGRQQVSLAECIASQREEGLGHADAF